MAEKVYVVSYKLSLYPSVRSTAFKSIRISQTLDRYAFVSNS